MSYHDPRAWPLRFISVLVRAPLAFLAAFELVCIKLFQLLFRPRFQVRGSCQHNGQCCHHLLFVEGGLERWPIIKNIYRFWLNGIYRFEATDNRVELGDGRVARIYRCGFFDDERLCRSHLLRPLVCRRYPEAAYYQAPRLHRGCGYQLVDRLTGDIVAPQDPEAPALRGLRTSAAALKNRWPVTVLDSELEPGEKRDPTQVKDP